MDVSNIAKVKDMLTQYEKYHWKFFFNSNLEVVVYEMREGNVIGTVPFSLEQIKEFIDNLSEEQVYEFIDSVIEYC